MSKEAVKSSKYEIDMTTGAILPKMLRFTLPLMASSMLQLLFNAADIIIVGKSGEMGDYYMGAVGSNGALINLLIGFFIGLSVGSNVIAARCFGSKDDEGLSKTVHTSMMIALVSGALLTVVGLLLSRQLLVLMGTPDELIGYSTTYLMIYFLGMIPTTVYNFGSSLLRAIGDTRRPLYYLTIAGVLNVLLNMFTVLVLDLNVAGVAIATVVSQTLSATLVVICLMREKGAIRFEWRSSRSISQSSRRSSESVFPPGFREHCSPSRTSSFSRRSTSSDPTSCPETPPPRTSRVLYMSR